MTEGNRWYCLINQPTEDKKTESRRFWHEHVEFDELDTCNRKREKLSEVFGVSYTNNDASHVALCSDESSTLLCVSRSLERRDL
jgi:hypothetical protein